jgi:dolichol-phosphate mannosyltransferase
MDGDLQDPPEVIPKLLERWGEGYDVVYAVRTKRKESTIKRLLYSLFYRILGRVSAVWIPSDSGDFALMDQRVVKILNAMPERGRFIRGLRAWLGFRQTAVEYEREMRFSGSPKYTWRKLGSLALDGLLSFSAVPLRAATALGILVSLTSFAGISIVLYVRLFTDNAVPGWAATVIPVLFLGGVQLLTIGILGEYLAQVLREVKRRPVYVVREKLGI